MAESGNDMTRGGNIRLPVGGSGAAHKQPNCWMKNQFSVCDH